MTHPAPDPLAAGTPAGRPRRLVPFRSLAGHQLAPGEPDIFGWPVVAAGGVPVGVVEELLVDAESAEVEALLVSAVGPDGGGRQVVAPLARHRIDAERRTVWSDLSAAEVHALPGTSAAGAAGAGPTTGVASRGAGAGAVDAAAAPFAGHPGVTVERTADGEEVIRVPIIEEQLVVEKRAVVKEVVVIRKRTVTEERVVEADLRRERLQVDHPDGQGATPGATPGAMPDERPGDGRR